jgi:hypothetical protein
VHAPVRIHLDRALIVVVIIGAISLVAFPRMQSAYQAGGLRAARARLITVYGAPARPPCRPTAGAVHFAGNALRVTATRAWPRRAAAPPTPSCRSVLLHNVFGVTATSSVDSLLLDPRARAQLGPILARQRYGADTITVTGFGRAIR